MKMVRIYEELNRVLAGRVDFNHFINVVAESFRQKMLNDIYTLWSGATANDLGGVAYFPTAGSYDEDDLLEVIAHVEAAAGGKPATIICTKKAARMLVSTVQSDSAMANTTKKAPVTDTEHIETKEAENKPVMPSRD